MDGERETADRRQKTGDGERETVDGRQTLLSKRPTPDPRLPRTDSSPRLLHGNNNVVQI